MSKKGLEHAISRDVVCLPVAKEPITVTTQLARRATPHWIYRVSIASASRPGSERGDVIHCWSAKGGDCCRGGPFRERGEIDVH